VPNEGATKKPAFAGKRFAVTLYRLPTFDDTLGMDIQQLSTGASQQKVLEEAAIKVQGMALGAVEEQAAGLAKLMESAAIITDPNLGNNVNIKV
jgi:hypothetical protein